MLNLAYDPAKSEQTKEEMKQKVIELAKNFKDNPQNMIEYLQFSTRFYNTVQETQCLFISKIRVQCFVTAIKHIRIWVIRLSVANTE